MILVAATLELNYDRDPPRVWRFHSFFGGIKSVVSLLLEDHVEREIDKKTAEVIIDMV